MYSVSNLKVYAVVRNFLLQFFDTIKLMLVFCIEWTSCARGRLSRHYLSKLFSMLKYHFQISNWYTLNSWWKWHAVGLVVLTEDQLSCQSKSSIPLQRSIRKDRETLHMKQILHMKGNKKFTVYVYLVVCVCVCMIVCVSVCMCVRARTKSFG